MKNDALQLFVRKFETPENGDKIVRLLQDYGFEIKEQFDSSADSLGGLIETHVSPVDSLACDDLEKIGQAVRRLSGEQTFLQYEFWDRSEGGDDRRPALEQHRPCLKFQDEVEEPDSLSEQQERLPSQDERGDGCRLTLKLQGEVEERISSGEPQKKNPEIRLKELNERIAKAREQVAVYEDAIQEHQDEIDEQEEYKSDAEFCLGELEEERAEICRQLGIELPEEDEE